MNGAWNQVNLTLSRTFAASLGILLLCTCTSLRAETELRAASVWLAEVEEMYETQVKTPEWVNKPNEFVVVRGIANGGSESARAIAIREVILPQLWGDDDVRRPRSAWEKHIAEREVSRWLDHSGNVVEQFEQPFSKTVDGEQYDVFVREAWLLDLSDANFDALKRRIQHSIQTTQRRKRYTLGTGIAIVCTMFFVSWFACAVLDRLTRGYYIGWLRLATTIFFLVSAGLAFQVTRIILGSL